VASGARKWRFGEAEARGCGKCVPVHSIPASVGKGKGEGRRGGDGLARPWRKGREIGAVGG
jgi:hypothetical protein